MNSHHVTRLFAGCTAACTTYLLVAGVVSLAGTNPRALEMQIAKAKAQVQVATVAPPSQNKASKKL